MPTVRTVLGDIPPEQVGITYPHEHVVLGYTGAREDLGPRFDREAVLTEICADLGQAVRQHGLKTVVDVTPPEVGRDVDILQEVSRRLDINVVAATGYYHQSGGFPLYWDRTEPEKYEERMNREVTEGVGPNGVKCGVLKISMNGTGLSDGEKKAFRAAARVSKALGVSICIHTSGWLLPTTDAKPGPIIALDVLLSEGADPSRIQVGHLEGTEGNLANLMEVARRGCYMAFDLVGRNPETWDPLRVAAVTGLAAAGYGDRILLSMDHQGAWVPDRPQRYVALKASFLDLYNFLPLLLKGGLKEGQVDRILVDNPRNLLTF
jgi:phosphotriesterase-related protein